MSPSERAPEARSCLTPTEHITVVDLFREPIPASWELIRGDESGRAWQCVGLGPARGLRIIETASRERDGRRWHHVSFSRESRLPTWDDITTVHALFIGAEREAYAVMAPRSRWVNEHRFCLHLWHCLDADEGAVLPDFRHLGSI